MNQNRRPKLIFSTAVALLLLAPPALSADIYKWKDADGKTHLSDVPPIDRDAQRLQIRTFAGLPEVSSTDEQATFGVVMLSTSWCGVCKQARAWLTQKGVTFTEYDVERNETGKSEYRRLKGQGVPIFLVGNQRMDGFSPGRLETMLPKTK
jgi:glutaredoxin